MFDIAWTEMLVIAIVTIVVVGPRDLPKVMKTVSSIIAKARSFAGKFQADMDQLAREAELEELREQARAMHAKLTAPKLSTSLEAAADAAAAARADPGPGEPGTKAANPPAVAPAAPSETADGAPAAGAPAAPVDEPKRG